MSRFALAAVLTVAIGTAAGAQPIAYPPSTPPLPPPPVAVTPTFDGAPAGAPARNVFVPPGTGPGPAIPFTKSGGVVVGAYGYYPYDTGNWLLGGFDGLTRQSGSFTMVFPESSGVGVGAPAARGGLFHGKHRR